VNTWADKILDIAFWIGLPIMHLVEGHPKKWVRLLGVLLTIPLAPLTITIAAPLLAVGALLSMVDL